jgi:hypothetical protein
MLDDDDNKFLNYNLDLNNNEMDSLFEWLRSLGLNVQTEVEVPMVDDIEEHHLPPPTGKLWYYGEIVTAKN